MRRFNVILFDLGSTLIYFDGEWSGVFAEAGSSLYRCLDQHGLILDRIIFLREFQNSLEAYYRERDTEFLEYTTSYVLRNVLARHGYPAIADELLRQAIDAMYSVTQTHWHIELDAHDTLRWLMSHGYRLGMVSNAGDDKDVQTLIDNANLRGYFEVIITSASLGIRKPNPRIFWSVLDKMLVPRNGVAMIGDTLGADILGARNAGIYSIWITRRADTPDNQSHRETIFPDASITTLDELPQLLGD